MIFSLVDCHFWRPWLAVNKSRTIFPHCHFKCIKVVKSVMSGPAQGEGLGGDGVASVSSHVLKKEN